MTITTDHDRHGRPPVRHRAEPLVVRGRALPGALLGHWQELLDTLADVAGARAARILRVSGDVLEVLVCSASAGNPYRLGERLSTDATSGFYATRVLGIDAPLHIADASLDPYWQTSPDCTRGLVAYLGVPLHAPDGTRFGVLDVSFDQPDPAPHPRLLPQWRALLEASLVRLQTDAARDTDPATPDADALRLSEERFRLLVENAGDDFFLHDDKGRFIDVNERACLSTGYTREELLRMRVIDLSIDFNQTEKERIWDATQPGATATVYSTHRRKDGSEFPVEVRISCHLIGGRKLFLGLVRDITERMESERAVREVNEALELRVAARTAELRKANALLEQAERLSRIGSWTLDLATGAFTASDMLYAMNHANPQGPPLTPDDLRTLLAPDSYEQVLAAMARCTTTGEPYGIDATHLRPDGSSFAVHIRGQATRNAAGHIIGLNGTVQDVSEREQARVRIATLADNLPNGAIFRQERRASGHVVLQYMSAGIQAMTGLSATEILEDERRFLALIHPDDRAHYDACQGHALAVAAAHDCQFRIHHTDGSLRWMHSRAAPSLDRQDGSSVWDGIIRDITQEKQVADALEQARHKAEQAERAKSDFLATMSHEIRTPMNSVIGMTRLMLQTPLAPRQRNYLDKIDASAQTLLRLINDILDFSKIEAGKLDLEDTDYTLDTVLDSVAAVTAMRAEEKGLELAFSLAPDVPRHLRGDSLRLGQVLTNLVGNAIKFTHQGEVIVSITRGASADTLAFAVRDTGIGLSDDQIATLFQPFSQASAHTSRHYGGTGLGLAISSQIVQGMGGTMQVHSTPGQGSTFAFTIRAMQTPAAVTRAQPSSHLQARRVLIVDDNASARAILQEMVQGFGMAVATASSGREALDTLRAASQAGAPFAIVLMDWRMPAMDGLEAARRIRADADLAYLPAVLMVTAYAREEVLQRVEHLGLQGLLIKPVTESVMFNTLLDTLAGTAASDTEPTPARRPGRTPQETFATLAGRRVLVVDDNALNREVACDFLLAVGMRVDTAEHGLAALDKLQHQSYDAILMDMHMPAMDGLTATRHIRRDARWATLPIVALTAQASVADRNASLAAGMTAHLTKPLDDMLLYATLRDVMAGNPPASIPDTPPAAEDALPADTLDLPGALARLGGDPARLERMLRGFARDFTDMPNRLQDAQQANNLSAVAALAHLVRGPASYFGADGFCTATLHLERAADARDPQAVRSLLPVVTAHLLQLLDQIQQALPVAAPVTIPEPGGLNVLALLATLDPLVARGDYAAHGLLQSLVTALTGTRHAAGADAAITHYEDLDIAQTRATLQRLKTALTEAPP